jgi:hypothetical protein
MAVTVKAGTLKGAGTSRCTLTVVDTADENKEYSIPNFNNTEHGQTIKEKVEEIIIATKAEEVDRLTKEGLVDAELSTVDPTKL